MTALFETIIARCPAPDVDVDGPLQLQVSQLDYSNYVGSIGIGRIRRGTIRRAMPVAVIDRDGDGAQRAHRPGVRLHGPRARRGRGGARRRHHRVLGPRGAEDLRHDLRPGDGRGAARARRRRADDQHDFRDQHLAAVRPGRQVRDQPPVARAAAARDAVERGAARRGDRRSRTASWSSAAASCTSAS